MEALLAGEAHMTAPYFNMDSFYQGRSRISQLGSSCTTMVRLKLTAFSCRFGAAAISEMPCACGRAAQIRFLP